MNQVSYMTQEGYDKIKHELDQLKSTGRQEVAKAIAEAREKVIYLKMLSIMQQKMLRECWK